MGFGIPNRDTNMHYLTALRFADAACQVARIAAARRRGEVGDSSSTPAAAGWTKNMYKCADAIAKDLNGVTQEELALGAFLAMQRRWVDESILLEQVMNADDCQRVYAGVVIALRRLRKWREERRSDALPSVEQIVLRLARHWASESSHHDLSEMSRDLASVFPAHVMTPRQAEELLRPHGTAYMTFEERERIADEALEWARRHAPA